MGNACYFPRLVFGRWCSFESTKQCHIILIVGLHRWVRATYDRMRT